MDDRGGLYTLAGDHRERSADLRREPYSTMQARVARVRSEEGLWVHRVIESGMVESEERRDQMDRDRHARQREEFRKRLAWETPEAEEGCRKLLNTWNEEREAPDGEISELERIEPDAPPTADDALVVALRGFFARNLHRAGETPSWLSVALWAEEYLDRRPPPAEVETALVELMSEAA